MKYNKLSFIILLIVTTFGLSGCEGLKGHESTNEKITEKTAQMMQEANKQVGMPNVNNWTEKKLVRDIIEMRDQENLLTYTYILDMNGNIHFIGRSMGFGIPASVQYTNPKKLVDADNEMNISTYQDNGRVQKMPQPDPNGLYMPEGLDATWVFLIDKEGNPRPVYFEPKIIVSPIKLH